MNDRFEKISKYFFWVSGLATALGGAFIGLFPVRGLSFVSGLAYLDQSPQVYRIISHWGILLAGLGVLLFVAATSKGLRKTTVIYATLEKAFIVAVALYNLLIGIPYASNYLVVICADGLMALGGIWYLLQSRKLNRI